MFLKYFYLYKCLIQNPRFIWSLLDKIAFENCFTYINIKNKEKLKSFALMLDVSIKRMQHVIPQNSR